MIHDTRFKNKKSCRKDSECGPWETQKKNRQCLRFNCPTGDISASTLTVRRVTKRSPIYDYNEHLTRWIRRTSRPPTPAPPSSRKNSPGQPWDSSGPYPNHRSNGIIISQGQSRLTWLQAPSSLPSVPPEHRRRRPISYQQAFVFALSVQSHTLPAIANG